jgi:hypothetical protein
MGREIRIALMLTAAACLVAVLVDWAVEELNSGATQPEAQQASAAVPDATEGEAGQAGVEAAQEDTGTAQDAAAESHDQG